MRHRRQHGGGQSVVEYAVLFSVVAAVVIGMQLYVKRGVQAKMKHASNFLSEQVGDGGVLGIPEEQLLQYEPYYTAAGNITSTTKNSRTEEMTAGGFVKTDINDLTSRGGDTIQDAKLDADNPWNASVRD